MIAAPPLRIGHDTHLSRESRCPPAAANRVRDACRSCCSPWICCSCPPAVPLAARWPRQPPAANRPQLPAGRAAHRRQSRRPPPVRPCRSPPSPARGWKPEVESQAPSNALEDAERVDDRGRRQSARRPRGTAPSGCFFRTRPSRIFRYILFFWDGSARMLVNQTQPKVEWDDSILCHSMNQTHPKGMMGARKISIEKGISMIRTEYLLLRDETK